MSDINNKIDLLGFQKSLNDQFYEILKNKNNRSDNMIEVAQLGLTQNISDIIFFLPLKDLKNISSDNKFETIALTKSWIIGFNQIRGNVYTIIDLEKIIDFIISKQITEEKKIINNNSNILYLKDSLEHKIGFVIDSLKMETLNELTVLFKSSYDKEKDLYIWTVENDLENIIKKGRIINAEFRLLSYLKKTFEKTRTFSSKDISHLVENNNEHNKLFWIMIDSVYIDKNNKLILSINFERLTKFLMTISSF